MTLPTQSQNVPIRVIAFLDADNLSGADLTVAGCTDFVGGTSPVEVAETDYVLGLTIQGQGVTGTVYRVTDGYAWQPINRQPVNEPGWIIAVVGSDLSFQSGMAAFFDSAGLLQPIASGRFSAIEATNAAQSAAILDLQA